MANSQTMVESEKKRVSLNEKVLKIEEGGNFYLLGSRCKCCGNVYFPQRIICPKCFKDDTMEVIPLNKKGKLYSYTVIRRQSLCPPGFTAPYAYGYIDLAEGVRALSALEGEIDSLTLDSKMELALKRMGEDESGNEITWYSFLPVTA